MTKHVFCRDKSMLVAPKLLSDAENREIIKAVFNVQSDFFKIF